jgi:ribosomal protein S18 acetylase RimI-like enzyme
MTLAPRTAPLEIRPAEERDVEGIQRVAREAWDQVYSGLFGAAERKRVLDHAFSRRTLLEDLSRHSSWFFVAAAGNGVVGFAELVLEGDTCGEVVRVAVTPEWQRRGIATALLSRGFAVLAAAGVSCVTAAVEPEDEACRALFERQGFQGSDDPLSDLDDVGMELAEYRRTLSPDEAEGEPPPEATVWIELDAPPGAPRHRSQGRSDDRGVGVLATSDESRLSFVESALEGAGIVYTLHRESSGEGDEEVVEVRVARSRIDAAREVLDSLNWDGDPQAADE